MPAFDVGAHCLLWRQCVDDCYEVLLPDDDFVSLSNIPLNRLQVLFLPPQTSDLQDMLALPDDACSHFE